MRKLLVATVATALVWAAAPALADPSDTSDESIGVGIGGVADPSAPGSEVGVTTDPATPEEVLDVAVEALSVKGDGPVTEALAARPDATLKLADLWTVKSRLSGNDARTAKALLARPKANRSTCTAHFCVHYTVGQASKSYVKLTKRTMEHVYGIYKKSGYRMPATDNGRGGNSKIDIYLLDLAKRQLYGYCQPETYVKKRKGNAAVGFCALDNDYKRSQYSTNTPTENLQVTAAHEFFHAVQFAYDVNEDHWLMEGMAAWVEDQVYPKVDDNIQYLYYSQLTTPWDSLDDANLGNSEGMAWYGSWAFFRYLSEQRPARKGKLPKIGLLIWKQLDSMRGKKRDQYSMQGVASALKKNRWSLEQAYSGFVGAALSPKSSFKEGGLYVKFLDKYIKGKYTGAPVPKSYQVNGAGSVTYTWNKVKLPHMSSASYRFAIPKSAAAAMAGKSLQVNLTGVSSWVRVLVTTTLKNGKTTSKLLTPASGAVNWTTSFDSATVNRVDVSFVNVSHSYTKCGKVRKPIKAMSCGGTGTPAQEKVSLSGSIAVG